METTRGLPAGLGERTTSSLGVWPWAQLAVKNGMPFESFCALAGVEAPALRDPEVRFSQAEANRVAELAIAQFGPEAPLEAARMIEAGHFNLLELIARSAPTVFAGLEQGCRFFPLLHDGGRMAFEALEAGALALRWYQPFGYTVHHGYVEMAFAVAVLGTRREAGDPGIEPAEVCFRHQAPGDRSRFERVFGIAPCFGAPQDRLVFDRHVAGLPLTRGSALVHGQARRTASELLDEGQPRGGASPGVAITHLEER
jgi:hypothetical protein